MRYRLTFIQNRQRLFQKNSLNSAPRYTVADLCMSESVSSVQCNCNNSSRATTHHYGACLSPASRDWWRQAAEKSPEIARTTCGPAVSGLDEDRRRRPILLQDLLMTSDEQWRWGNLYVNTQRRVDGISAWRMICHDSYTLAAAACSSLRLRPVGEDMNDTT